MIAVELAGLEVFGRHGVTDEERSRGQVFLYDVRFEVAEAARSDRLEDTVDYEQVAACVKEISDTRQFALLEALAVAVAEAILERFPVETVRVRARKRDVRPGGLPVEWTAATVERTSSRQASTRQSP
jgi:7,8-dihydroneopterin aldolase/epimerase/oxygenase